MLGIGAEKLSGAPNTKGYTHLNDDAVRSSGMRMFF